MDPNAGFLASRRDLRDPAHPPPEGGGITVPKKATAAKRFEHALSARFIDQLELLAAKGGWWADVLADPTLVVAVRGTSLNVYWRGQSLFQVRAGPSGPTATTHEKYLTDPELADQVPLVDGEFDVAKLLQRGLIRQYEGPGTLKKTKATSRLFSGTEKTGCHEIAVRNDTVIDVEVAFPGLVSLDDGGSARPAPRVDLASVEADGADARLVVWEAKAYANGELRAIDSRPPPVCRQIAIYRKYLADNREAVEHSFTRVAANFVALKAMGWKRPLSPLINEIASGKRRLTLGREPKVGLLIFGFNEAERVHDGWKKHLARLKAAVPDVQAKGDAKLFRI